MHTSLRVFFSITGLILATGFNRPGTHQQDSGRDLYLIHCSSCHDVHFTIVGPALAYIDKRRDRKWLYAMTRDNAALLRAGDPSAVYLHCKSWPEYFSSPLHAFTFTDQQLDQLYAYIDEESSRRKLPFVDDHFKSTVDSCVLYKRLKADHAAGDIERWKPRDCHCDCKIYLQ